MAALFQPLEDFWGGFRFGLSDAVGDAEPGVDVKHGRPPELARRVGFGIVLFSPLLPT
jgi:hypothetical protein